MLRVLVTEAITSRRGDVVELVEQGFEGVDPSGVEVRVERATRPWQSFTGRAYSHPLQRPRPHPSTRFLVRLWLPSVFRNRAYPKVYRYPKRKTAPWITVHDWRERLLALAAHEAFHVHQFRENLRRSEVAAERWADQVLNRWRAVAATNPLVVAAGEGSRQWALFDPGNFTECRL